MRISDWISDVCSSDLWPIRCQRKASRPSLRIWTTSTSAACARRPPPKLPDATRQGRPHVFRHFPFRAAPTAEGAGVLDYRRETGRASWRESERQEVEI